MDIKKSYKSIDYPHNRFNPLKNEWVLVCPHRSKRPWMGQLEKDAEESNSQDIKSINPLSPGATRSSGEQNPDYTGTFIFDNDFPALIDDCPTFSVENFEDKPLFRIEPARGRCRVMCFHPDSQKSLPLMSVEEIQRVIDAWIEEFKQMSIDGYRWIQIFENKGSMMGCSNPHPHCQIWASRFLPNEPGKMDHNQREYYQKHGQPLLLDYIRQELKNEERIILKNEHWVVLVPFWAVWPFETMILPHHRHVKRIDELNHEERRSLAIAMKTLLIKYDNLFRTSFPYSMAWYGSPINSSEDHWTLHAVYFPPLLRSATIKKFMVGYEMAAQAQRDITPEKAAEILRETTGHQHYSKEEIIKHFT